MSIDGREQLLGYRQRPYSRGNLSVRKADVRDERSLPVRDGVLRNFHFPIGHLDPAGPAEQIERPLDFDARLVIGAPGFLLLEERQRRIGSEGRLFA